ncbi:hypothetical protein CRI94_04970 [Longibacter salinarum]|uniref:Uncharacterized protein n=1 Tax=Longibacter salinarum TaxID=1850348 RepID=A0A2A8D166_9BACT|nr:hypothetical protein [Longibacter salinarum]PEN14388.1 hypothetical protein CRI94_04970 [Longibacter salinarum]
MCSLLVSIADVLDSFWKAGVSTLLVVAVAISMLTACDQVPGSADRSLQPPVVADFDYSPDSVDAGTVDPSRVTDTTVTVDLRLLTAVEDTDSDIERVVFTIEPGSAPRATIDGTLSEVSGQEGVYGAAIDLTLPRADALYTLRVFAVDTDSLTSNVGLGQLRVLPGTP